MSFGVPLIIILLTTLSFSFSLSLSSTYRLYRKELLSGTASKQAIKVQLFTFDPPRKFHSMPM